MSKSKSAARRENLESKNTAASISKPVQYLAPYRPRRGVMVFLGLILLIWMIGLLAMYFTTVRPDRKQNPRPPSHVPETAWRMAYQQVVS